MDKQATLRAIGNYFAQWAYYNDYECEEFDEVQDLSYIVFKDSDEAVFIPAARVDFDFVEPSQVQVSIYNRMNHIFAAWKRVYDVDFQNDDPLYIERIAKTICDDLDRCFTSDKPLAFNDEI